MPNFGLTNLDSQALYGFTYALNLLFGQATPGFTVPYRRLNLLELLASCHQLPINAELLFQADPKIALQFCKVRTRLINLCCKPSDSLLKVIPVCIHAIQRCGNRVP
ncbi:hypothetical protein GPROT2_01617 [Gammaproteobacteria bacterium]|nr:hypothetical protein GPROT2_01617 [Gammaproteobacteria bacterium]